MPNSTEFSLNMIYNHCVDLKRNTLILKVLFICNSKKRNHLAEIGAEISRPTYGNATLPTHQYRPIAKAQGKPVQLRGVVMLFA